MFITRLKVKAFLVFKVMLLMSLLTSGCVQAPLTSPLKTILPTITGVTLGITPTPSLPSTIVPSENVTQTEELSPTATSSSTPFTISTVSVGEIKLSEFHTKKDFIIYPDSDPSGKQIGIWAISPVDKIPIYIKRSENFMFGELSPSQKYRLFYGPNALYTALPDGSRLSVVYKNDRYSAFTAHWIDDTTIMFNAFADLYSQPDIYSLNIETGLLTPFDLTRNKAIQGVFPSLGSWIEVNLLTYTYEIYQLDGFHQPIFENYQIAPYPWYGETIQWIDSLQEFIFIGAKEGEQGNKIWALSKDFTSSRILFDLKDRPTSTFALSPNERYIGINIMSNDMTQAHTMFVNVKTGVVDFEWSCPYRFGDFPIVWSPDSKYIACPYASPHTESLSSSAFYGIQVLNVRTGAIDVVLKDKNFSVTSMDWVILNP